MRLRVRRGDCAAFVAVGVRGIGKGSGEEPGVEHWSRVEFVVRPSSKHSTRGLDGGVKAVTEISKRKVTACRLSSEVGIGGGT